jgi:hypothetical protein
MENTAQPSASLNRTDVREALYNDRRTGLAGQIQLPREAITRLHGLVVDLDANLLGPNPWFPPADTAVAFHAAIKPALERHPVLRHAEVRDTGRWLHALVRFDKPVELMKAADQQHWFNLHRVLMGSVPSDPAVQPLIALTRPTGSINSKTGREVKVLEEGRPIEASLVEGWVEQVQAAPFKSIGSVLFGNQRVSPCPYCRGEDSFLDLGETAGFCYGSCRQVPLARLFEPFLKKEQPGEGGGEKPAGRKSARKGRGKPRSGEEEAPVIRIDRDTVLLIDPSQVSCITIKVCKE